MNSQQMALTIPSTEMAEKMRKPINEDTSIRAALRHKKAKQLDSATNSKTAMNCWE